MANPEQVKELDKQYRRKQRKEKQQHVIKITPLRIRAPKKERLIAHFSYLFNRRTFYNTALNRQRQKITTILLKIFKTFFFKFYKSPTFTKSTFQTKRFF